MLAKYLADKMFIRSNQPIIFPSQAVKILLIGSGSIQRLQKSASHLISANISAIERTRLSE